MNAEEYNQYLTDEQKARHYDALFKEWRKLHHYKHEELEKKYQQISELMPDWALIQHQMEDLIRIYLL